jgi:uncharacterized membrane protein/uncharacterized membrane protein YeaQ/YmgE (transglycosylase-associated protein family)
MGIRSPALREPKGGCYAADILPENPVTGQRPQSGAIRLGWSGISCQLMAGGTPMHVWQWLLTGLVAGLLARLVLRNSDLGLGGDLALGSFGGIAAGILVRYSGVTTPGAGLAHVIVALVGASGMIVTMHLLLKATHKAGRLLQGVKPPASLEAALSTLGERERRVLSRFLSRQPVARDAVAEEQERETLGQRAADRIASFGGSWPFLGIFAAVLLAWMTFNDEATRPFDPYPFILLNLVLSCVAAVQAPIILMSQNRQTERDRLHARLDYEVNLKAEVEILALHEKLDELRLTAWRDLLAIQERQVELLEKLQAGRGEASGAP